MTTIEQQQQQHAKHTSTSGWIPIVEDEEVQSYAYFLPFSEDQCEGYGATVKAEAETDHCWISREKLDEWFDALHPSRYNNNTATNNGKEAWTDSYHKNIKLLRKTAWVSLDPNCTCEYGYADTWQHQATDPSFIETIQDITNVVVSYFQKTRNQRRRRPETTPEKSGIDKNDNLFVFNAVNLNYYPHGGGVGFHADDEYLFDGLNRPTCILSLSLCSSINHRHRQQEPSKPKQHDPMNKDEREDKGDVTGSNDTFGARKFVIKLKNPGDTEETVQSFDDDGDVDTTPTPNKTIEVILKHGDLMTMEGMFQKYFYHAVWPGDSKQFWVEEDRPDNDDVDQPHHHRHPYTEGERINLTWRLIVQHLDGSQDECRGKTCPLAAERQAT